jgi:hypothetical protein
MELVTRLPSLTMFNKIEDAMLVLLVPFLVWEAGAKLFRGGKPERDS